MTQGVTERLTLARSERMNWYWSEPVEKSISVEMSSTCTSPTSKE